MTEDELTLERLNELEQYAIAGMGVRDPADYVKAVNIADLLALIAEVRRLREGWRPISEAPRDKTEIIGHDIKTGVTHVTCWEHGWHDPDAHYYSEAPDFNPTHFMPLPAPPQDSASD